MKREKKTAKVKKDIRKPLGIRSSRMEGRLVPSEKGNNLFEALNGFRYQIHHKMSKGR